MEVLKLLLQKMFLGELGLVGTRQPALHHSPPSSRAPGWACPDRDRASEPGRRTRKLTRRTGRRFLWFVPHNRPARPARSQPQALFETRAA